MQKFLLRRYINTLVFTEAFARRCSATTRTSLFLIKLQAEACNFIKKKTLAQVYSCEFCEISKEDLLLQNTSGCRSVFTTKIKLQTLYKPMKFTLLLFSGKNISHPKLRFWTYFLFFCVFYVKFESAIFSVSSITVPVFIEKDFKWVEFNDTHREKLVFYWIQYKNSLKCKVGCFWRFSYVYTIN